MSKGLKILTILYLAVLLTGCWDKIEINDRAFVSAVGYDIYDEKFYKEAENRDAGKIEVPQMTERNRFVITYVFPNLKAIGKNATSQKTRYVISSVSNNPYETTAELSTRMNKVFFFKHAKVLIFGEEFAKNQEFMKEALDNIERHDQLSRKIYVFIAEGTAKEVADVEDVIESETGTLLSQIFQKKQNTARYNPQALQDILGTIEINGSALIPRVIPGKEELKVAGSAVIKNYKFIGWLGELENRSVMFLNNKVKAEVVNVEIDKTWMPFIITDSFTKKSAKIEDNNITIDITIEMEGYIQQYKLESKADLLDDKMLKSIENEVENVLNKEIKGTLEKIQKEYKVDIIGIGDYLSKFKPSVWENVKDDWENIFPDVEINVSIDAKLRRIGMTK